MERRPRARRRREIKTLSPRTVRVGALVLVAFALLSILLPARGDSARCGSVVRPRDKPRPTACEDALSGRRFLAVVLVSTAAAVALIGGRPDPTQAPSLGSAIAGRPGREQDAG